MKDAKFVATDAEVEKIEQLAKAMSLPQWPALIRIINRMRNAEEALQAAAKPEIWA